MSKYEEIKFAAGFILGALGVLALAGTMLIPVIAALARV
jgi:hypothetical protein